jgi:hypothetical protein
VINTAASLDVSRATVSEVISAHMNDGKTTSVKRSLSLQTLQSRSCVMLLSLCYNDSLSQLNGRKLDRLSHDVYVLCYQYKHAFV